MPLIACHVALLAVRDLGRVPGLTLALVAASFAAFWWAGRRLERVVEPAAVLIVAVLLRLLLVPLPPTLSDDLLRYVWDGRVTTAGFNPYRLAPAAEELQALRDEAWQRMPHREVPTVYPPLALAVFSIASLLPAPMTILKLLLVAIDLTGCWLLIRLLAALGRGPGRALWYAWNPLVTLEVAGMGHVDALMAAALIATALALLRQGGVGVPALAAAGAVLAKLVPLIALPMWARQSGRPWRFALLAGAVVGALFAPFLIDLGGPPPGLVTYGVQWEFNGPLYEPAWRTLDQLAVSERIKNGLDSLKQLTGRHQLLNHVYPFVYPQLLAKLGLGLALLAVIGHSLTAHHPVLGTGRLVGGFLLCSATFYPWYLLAVLPFAAAARHRAWLALSALLPLAYLPQLASNVALMPWVYLAIWVPFGALLWRCRWSID